MPGHTLSDMILRNSDPSIPGFAAAVAFQYCLTDRLAILIGMCSILFCLLSVQTRLEENRGRETVYLLNLL